MAIRTKTSNFLIRSSNRKIRVFNPQPPCHNLTRNSDITTVAYNVKAGEVIHEPERKTY